MAGDLTWSADPHNADTDDLRDRDGRLRGWVAWMRDRRRWRGTVSDSKPPCAMPVFRDFPNILDARAWVEDQVQRVSHGR